MTVTRYPKQGKGRKWTIKELEAISGAWKGDTLSDGEGLSGEVRVAADGAVSVRFKYAFRWSEKVVWYQCGTWPTVSLEAVRAARDQARDLVGQGINPNDQRKAQRIEAQAQVEAVIAAATRQEAENLSVRAMFDAWIADGVARADGNAELRRSFEKDVLPSIGAKPVKEITEHDLRALLRAMVKRGVYRMTVRTYNDLVQMFAWAEKRKPWRTLMVDGNAAELLEIDKILPVGVDTEKPRERILSDNELRELRSNFENAESAYAAAPAGKKYETARPLKKESRLALWICLSTTCRIGELLMSRWEHVNLEAGEWFVPAENTKTGSDWLVFLSPFALRQFKALKALTGDTPYCFPARAAKGEEPDQHVCVKSVSKQVGDRQAQFKQRKGPLKNRCHDNSLVLAGGANGEWTSHDLRRTGATLMQSLKVPPDVIDRCQNHVLAGSRVRRHYLHYEYADEKRDAWTKLGDRLDLILNGAFASPSS
ncbi:tyrosine-type recombinase/integrase [Roseateles sp. DC23W]|uniref:Tyrosine-type recombinase/integrase n=1 Tax=Pelomonas dachongensis TaxID=3299029 RepID=A0ABW7EYF4_9BURK